LCYKKRMSSSRTEGVKKPPLSPRLSIYAWRSPMLASLLHRVSGILLVVFVPIYLWLLRGLTGSAADFSSARRFLHTFPGRLWLWLTAAALVYHLCNGIRFLLLDAGWGEDREWMRTSARLVLAAGGAASIVLAAELLL